MRLALSVVLTIALVFAMVMFAIVGQWDTKPADIFTWAVVEGLPALALWLLWRPRRRPDADGLRQMLRKSRAKRIRQGGAQPSHGELFIMSRLAKAGVPAEIVPGSAAPSAVIGIAEPPPEPDHVVAGLSRVLGMDYRDGRGHETQRRVTVHEAIWRRAAAGDLQLFALHAYCHVRKQSRTLRVDRIARAYEPVTGEMIDDLQTWLGVPERD